MTAATPPSSPHDPGHNTGSGQRAASRMVLLAALNYSRFAIFLLVGLLMTPMMIGAFGIAMWGLFMLISLCRWPFQDILQPVLTKELATAWASTDPTARRRAFSNGVAVSLLSAFVGVLVTGAAVPAVLYGLKYPAGAEREMLMMVLTEGAMLVLMLGMGPWVNMFLAAHRLVENNVHRTFERIQDLIALVPVLYILPIAKEHQLIAFLLARLALRIAHLAVCWWRARLVEPDARAKRSLIDRETLSHYTASLGWSSSIPVANQVYYMADHLLLNHFFGALFNGIYQITQQLRGYARILGGGVSFGAEGITADLHARGNHDAVRRLLLTAMKATSAITCICTVLIAVFTGALMNAWLGKQLANDPDLVKAGVPLAQAVELCWVFFLILAPGIVITEAGFAATTILFGMGHVKRFAPALLVMTVLKFVLTWLVLRATSGGFDVYHVLLAAVVTTALNAAVFGVYYPLLIKRLVGVRFRDQIISVYARPLLSTVPVALLGWLCATYLGPWTPGVVSMTKLGLCMGVLMVLWFPMAAWIIPEGSERDRVRSIIHRLAPKVPGGAAVARLIGY
jgi:O-antigen/teichoic acid export membrane protein